MDSRFCPGRTARHSDLRAHALLEPLELPTYDAGPKQAMGQPPTMGQTFLVDYPGYYS